MATPLAVDLQEPASMNDGDHEDLEPALTAAGSAPRTIKPSQRARRRRQSRRDSTRTVGSRAHGSNQQQQQQQHATLESSQAVHLPVDHREQHIVSPARIPSTASATLANQLVFYIEGLQLHGSWVPLLVSQVGLNACLDAAVQTICHATHWHALKLNGYNSFDVKRKALTHNVRTLHALQELIRSPDRLSDYALGTICLLEWYEILVPENVAGPSALVKHMNAFRALLLARPRSEAPTELARAIVHTSVPFHFNFSTDVPGHAVHTLFENDERWLEPTVNYTNTLPVYLMQLRRSALAIFMRVPPLIREVAAIRRGEAVDIDAVQSRATALLSYETSECENLLLHNVAVRKSTSTDDLTRKVAPYCFKFPGQHYLLGSINYWQTRMMVLQLCLGLDELSTTPWLTAEQTDHFVAELDRMTRNAVMSWEWIHSDYLPGRMQYVPLLKIVFASLARLADEQYATDVREWIMHRRTEAGIPAAAPTRPVSKQQASSEDGMEPAMASLAKDWHVHIHKDNPDTSEQLGALDRGEVV